MRVIFLACAGVALMTGCANAATYQLSYTGKRMVGQTGEGVKPIRGVKHLSIVVESSTPFPKNSCVNIPLTAVTTFTDGVDTPASLAASGYVLQGDSFFTLCMDKQGKKPVSWRIGYDYTRTKGRLRDYYGAGSFFPAQPPDPIEDNAFFSLAKAKGGGRVLENINYSDPGRWKYQVLSQ